MENFFELAGRYLMTIICGNTLLITNDKRFTLGFDHIFSAGSISLVSWYLKLICASFAYIIHRGNTNPPRLKNIAI